MNLTELSAYVCCIHINHESSIIQVSIIRSVIPKITACEVSGLLSFRKWLFFKVIQFSRLSCIEISKAESNTIYTIDENELSFN